MGFAWRLKDRAGRKMGREPGAGQYRLKLRMELCAAMGKFWWLVGSDELDRVTGDILMQLAQAEPRRRRVMKALGLAEGEALGLAEEEAEGEAEGLAEGEAGEAPLISIGPSGLGGQYQKEIKARKVRAGR